ncbi:MAG: prephenate dehydrogenase [Longimicrobiales bacterium]
MTIAILGLGLIGGSLARELTRRGHAVSGWDRDAGALSAAREAGAIRDTLEVDLEGLRGAEVVLLAVPVDAGRTLLERVARRALAARLIMDTGSTKRGIIAAAEQLGVAERFVGAHPIAGHHRHGFAASRESLFEHARVFLCPCTRTREAALAEARGLWSELGALPEVVDAEEHDRRLAWASHLPQASASALALSLAHAGLTRAELGPGGRDATRLAASSPAMWTAIALENADVLCDALGVLEASLAELREAIRRGDATAVREWFAAAAEWQ